MQFYNETKKALVDAGVKNGDLVFVQSSMIPLLKKIDKNEQNIFLDDVCNALTDLIGNEGTICFPMFSYSFFNKTVFDPEEPPTNGMGILSVLLWSKRKCVRSIDPLFSVGASGTLEKDLTENLPKTCFGEDSFFDRFYNLNGKLLQIGVSVDGSTSVMYFEQKLKSKYRYLKSFSGEIKIDGELHKETWETYVRRLDGTVTVDLRNLKERIEQDGYINRANLMEGFIYCIESKQFYTVLKQYLAEDPLFLIKH